MVAKSKAARGFWGEATLTFQKANVVGAPRRVYRTRLAEICVRAAVATLRSSRTGVARAHRVGKWSNRFGTPVTFGVGYRRAGVTRVAVFETRTGAFNPRTAAELDSLLYGVVGSEAAGMWDKGERRFAAFAAAGELAAARPYWLEWRHPPADELAAMLCQSGWEDPAARVAARDALADWLGHDDLPGHDPAAKNPATWLWAALGRPMYRGLAAAYGLRPVLNV